MGLRRRLDAAGSAAVLAALLATSPFLPACGGGGGGASPVPPVDDGAPTVARSATVVFVDPGAPSPDASSAPARAAGAVVVGGRTYATDAAGIARDVPFLDGERLDLGGVVYPPAFAAGDSLVVKAIRRSGATTHAAGVYFRPAAGGGVRMRSDFAYAWSGETRLVAGAEETGGEGRLPEVLGDFLARSEAAAARDFESPVPPVNPAAVFAALPAAYANALTGELTLVVEPVETRIQFAESVRHTAFLRDARGLRTEVRASWTVDPPDLVNLESTGRVIALDKPGTVVVTARFENLAGTASVTVLSAVDGQSLSGTLQADRTLSPDADYYIVGDLTIPAGLTLTVLGGTTVRFLANADNTATGENPARSELVVEGTLRVTGLVTQNAVFRSSNLKNPERTDYFGIRVTPTGTADLSRLRVYDAAYGAKCDGGRLTMSFCRVEHSLIGAYVTGDAAVRIEACEIAGCVSGIEMRQVPSGKVFRNFVADNDWNGITLYASNPVVWGNVVARHRNTGLSVHANSAPVVRNNIVNAGAVYGLFVDRTARPSVKWNIIDHSPSYGAFLERESSTELRDNVLLGNYRALGFRNGMEMRFGYNLFSFSTLLNFFNVETRNDVYDGPYEGGTIPISVSLLPNSRYGDPRFKGPNYDQPNLGDFSLHPTSEFRFAGENSGPVGLLDPVDVGTASVRVGQEVN